MRFNDTPANDTSMAAYELSRYLLGLGVNIEAPQLQAVLRNNWSHISRLAHSVHGKQDELWVVTTPSECLGPFSTASAAGAWLGENHVNLAPPYSIVRLRDAKHRTSEMHPKMGF